MPETFSIYIPEENMKAAVLQGPRRIEIEDFPDPEVEPDGVVVKVRASGICGSDLHPYKLSTTKMVLGPRKQR